MDTIQVCGNCFLSTTEKPSTRSGQLTCRAASDTDNEYENFCDASEGRHSSSRPPSREPSPIPPTQIETTVSPTDTETPGSFVNQTPTADATPDGREKGNEKESPSISRSNPKGHKQKKGSGSIISSGDTGRNGEAVQNNDNDDYFGEDFDDFEVGEGDGEQDDDFGDFDDAFEEPTPTAAVRDTTQDRQDISGEQSPQPHVVSSLNDPNWLAFSTLWAFFCLTHSEQAS